MLYTTPNQFEPLLPQLKLEPLYELTQLIIEIVFNLKKQIHPATGKTLSQLLRAMNSYYSNKIEGYSTHPLNIEQGLKHHFSDKPKIAKLQRLAIAYIDTEKEIETWITNNNSFSPFASESIREIHAALYNHLPEDERISPDGQPIIPGEWRKADVEVGIHIPPAFTSVHTFLKRYEEVYDKRSSLDQQLIKIACAHQRLAWIHPFLDGNGRVARLATHAALYRDFTGGLWSVCRGLARTQQEYYANLQNADEPRRGDLDGRGNLSEEGLRGFCHYFLTVCLDQVSFMQKMLDFDGMRLRIRALLIFRSELNKKIRREAELPLHYLFTSGALTRHEFKQMTGLNDRTAQSLLSELLKTGLVESDTSLGPVRFGLPLDALQFYFPGLYPEAAATPNEK
ncbi:MAG: Fic family protein [Proteobacteria bacterium]|nr:Fic family protein [Pseudomonadota bacterium]